MMQYTSVSLLSLFALGVFAKPTPQTVESVPDEPVPAGGGPALAASDALDASSAASVNGKSSWDLSYPIAAKYIPTSVGPTDCLVHNMIGIQESQKGALTDCYENSNKLWGTTNCGLLTWLITKDGGHWKNSQDCWGRNKACIEGAIKAGFGDVECISGTGTSDGLNPDHCKVAYSYTTPLAPQNILDPKNNPTLH